MARILAVAENFAFGPISKLMTVARALQERGHEIMFIGTGTAHQIASRSGLSEVAELDTDAPGYLEKVQPWMDRADAVLSCMDRSSVLAARHYGKPVIWLDILFWWWDELPDFVLDADLYLVQNTLDSRANLAKWGDRLRAMRQVGPIVDLSRRREQPDNQLLVGFGGMEAAGWYAVGKESNYPFSILRMLSTYADLSDFDRVVLAGNARIIPQLAEAFAATGWEFACLGRDEYLTELGRSAALLTVPGLETPLEAWAYGVPAIFLPPSNSSQYVQLDDFVEEGVAEARVHFRHFLPGLDLRGRPLRDIMAEFLYQLAEYEQHEEWLVQTGDMVTSMLRDRSAWPALVEVGTAYMQRLGGNGLAAAIGEIEAFLARIGVK
jgi:hypothetical protein